MASVKFPRKEFEKHMKLNPEIEKKISMFGTNLESISENEIELEILPNRPDLLSLEGFMRSFKAFIDKSSEIKYRIKANEKNKFVKVENSVSSVRPYTVCAIVKKLSFDEDKIKGIIDLQEKLHSTLGRNRKKIAIGIYPLDKISFPIKFEARKPEEIRFKPLEYDREMSGREILQKHPTGKEFAHLLQGELYPVFVDSKENILSMPPIINSNETGRVTTSTKEVFVECSGSDLNSLKKTLNIIVTTLADMGGEINAVEVRYDKEKIITPNLSPDKIKVSLENINSLLGIELSEKELSKLLPKMGHEYSKGNVSVPAWRTDILHEVDVIEDVAIAYGYENIVPEIPQISTIGEESEMSIFKKSVSNLLVGLGFDEISSFHLVKPDEIALAGIPEKYRLELENSKTEYKFLRPNLMIAAMRTFAGNKDNEYPQKIFEMGTVFTPEESEKSGIKETENLVIACSPSNFTEIKQVLDYILKITGLEYTLKESNSPGFIDGRTASIIVGKKSIGYFGEIHPETLRNWNIKMPVSALEISLNDLYNLVRNQPK